MIRVCFVLFFICCINSLQAKENNKLKDKVWKAVKSYVKETDTYKTFDSGRKVARKIRDKIEKKVDKLKK